MGVKFNASSIGTSSLTANFVTLDIRAPITPTSGPILIDQTRLSQSDAGIITPYKPGQRQLRFEFIWKMLDITEYEGVKEFLEKIDGSNNWFTLQDHFIPKKTNINCETLSDNDIVYNVTDLASSQWPDKPIGKYVFATLGANNNLRRRITEYQSGGPGVVVSPAFPNVFNIGTPDTFIIGTPVIIMPDQVKFVPRLNNFWDMSMTFLEKGD